VFVVVRACVWARVCVHTAHRTSRRYLLPWTTPDAGLQTTVFFKTCVLFAVGISGALPGLGPQKEMEIGGCVTQWCVSVWTRAQGPRMRPCTGGVRPGESGRGGAGVGGGGGGHRA
jgi:hypothetical protein